MNRIEKLRRYWRAMVGAVRDDPAVALMLLVNLAIGADILWSDGGVQTALFVYWLELAVVALFTAAKMPFVHPIGGTLVAGIFVGVCLMMMRGLLVFFGALAVMTTRAAGETPIQMLEDLVAELPRPILWLVVSHGYSYWRNYLVRGEFRGATLEDLFAGGFVRIALTWIGIIPAALIAVLIHPGALVGLVIVGKIALDLLAHRGSHRRLRKRLGREAARTRSLSRELVGMAPYAVFLGATTLLGGPLRELGQRAGQPLIDRAEARFRLKQRKRRPCDSGKLQPCLTYCKAGDARACSTLAWSYRRGQGVNEDPGQARQLFSRSCALGSGSACGQVGQAYFFGKRLDVSRDFHKARPYLRKGCDRDDASSCYFIGILLIQGLGGHADRALAKQAFDKGCAIDKHPASCHWAKRLEPDGGRSDDRLSRGQHQ